MQIIDRLTCCAVSIRSFSRSRAWKPFNSTSSVDAGTVVVKVVRKERDVRLQRSSIGNYMNPRNNADVTNSIHTQYIVTNDKLYTHGFGKNHSCAFKLN